MEEPPAVEGYLDAIRPNKQTKQPVYLATYAGYLFFLDPARPFPPMPPGPMPSTPEPDINLKHMEVRRGINQIVHATSMMDLRSIVAIRRAFQLIPSPTHAVKEAQDDDCQAWVEPEARSSEDDVDEGGEAVLAQAYDSARVKMRRSFELLLITGHVMRYEVFVIHCFVFP
jgi:hypothetical protein